MIPETTTFDSEGDVLIWKNSDFQISVEEARAIKQKIEDALSAQSLSGILVDNSEASGTWPEAVNGVWEELMAEIYSRRVPCATLAASATNTMQINRLSRQNDTLDLIKAFQPGKRKQALRFLDTDEVSIQSRQEPSTHAT